MSNGDPPFRLSAVFLQVRFGFLEFGFKSRFRRKSPVFCQLLDMFAGAEQVLGRTSVEFGIILNDSP
jgi:hypothetical protein